MGGRPTMGPMGLIGGGGLLPVPPGLLNLPAWYDAQDIDLLGNASLTDTQLLNLWKNKGSLGALADLSQVSVPNQPSFKLVAEVGKLNGLSSVLFSGAQDMISPNVPAMTAPFKMAGVVYRAASGGDVFWDGNDGVSRCAFFAIASWTMYAGASLSTPGSPADLLYHQTTQYWNNASSVLRLNGVQENTGNVGTAALDGFRVGVGGDGTSFLTGQLVEWLVWWGGAFPSDADIEAYFDAKYGTGWPQ